MRQFVGSIRMWAANERTPMPYAVGDIVDPFTFPRAGGGETTVAPSDSAATVVVWTCNHCPYALAWHDRIQQVARDYADRGVTMIQINANNAETHPHDSFEAMAERVAAGDFASDYVRDEDQTISKQWGAKVTPDVFVLDSSSRLVYRGAPDADHDDPSQGAAYLRAALDDVLAGCAVATPETKPRGCGVKWIVNDQPNPHV